MYTAYWRYFAATASGMINSPKDIKRLVEDYTEAKLADKTSFCEEKTDPIQLYATMDEVSDFLSSIYMPCKMKLDSQERCIAQTQGKTGSKERITESTARRGVARFVPCAQKKWPYSHQFGSPFQSH